VRQFPESGELQDFRARTYPPVFAPSRLLRSRPQVRILVGAFVVCRMFPAVLGTYSPPQLRARHDMGTKWVHPLADPALLLQPRI
jgi:hypothetical protein